LPNIEGDVLRNKEIKVTYWDLKGQKNTIKLTDFDAAIVQHEIDHLNGVLFIDRI
jgi:peptide deformylase